MIISVSRRTDIPHYHANWFVNSLMKGFLESVNPFNPLQKKIITLRESNQVHTGKGNGIVFWTRYCAEDFFPALDILHKYSIPYYFLYTCNAYGNPLEPGSPTPEKVEENFIHLLETSDPELSGGIIWRYDPIVLTDMYDMEYHYNMFSDLCKRFSSYTKSVIISLYDTYTAAERRLKKVESKIGALREYSPNKMEVFFNRLQQKALAEGITMQSCADERITNCSSIPASPCIDPDKFPTTVAVEKGSTNQRKNCMCIKSTDIGAYNSCPAGCLYCYAVRGTPRIENQQTP